MAAAAAAAVGNFANGDCGSPEERERHTTPFCSFCVNIRAMHCFTTVAQLRLRNRLVLHSYAYTKCVCIHT